jgi:predicted kinase
VTCPVADDKKLPGRSRSAVVLCDTARMGGYVVLLCGRSFSGKSTVARKLQAALDGTVVSFDDTSSPRFLRDGWRRLSADLGTHLVLVFIDASREAIIRRQAANRSNGERDDVIGGVMAEHLDAFEPPAEDEGALCFAAENLSMPEVVAAVKNAHGLDRVKPEFRVDQDRMARPDVRFILTLIQVSPSGEHRSQAGRHRSSA